MGCHWAQQGRVWLGVLLLWLRLAVVLDFMSGSPSEAQWEVGEWSQGVDIAFWIQPWALRGGQAMDAGCGGARGLRQKDWWKVAHVVGDGGKLQWPWCGVSDLRLAGCVEELIKNLCGKV